MRAGDHRLNYARMAQIRNHLAALYSDRKKISPHHYDVGMRFINEHVLAELGRSRREALNPEERKMILDLLPQRYANSTLEGKKKLDALELLKSAGPVVVPLFEHFIKTLEALSAEDQRFKKLYAARHTTTAARENPARNPVPADLFANPLFDVLAPVHYGEYFGVPEPRTIAGYLAYLRKYSD